MHRRHALKLLGGTAAGLGAGLALPVTPLRAASCVFYPHVDGWHFTVLRHGDVIGNQVFHFTRLNGDFVVDISIDIAVELLGITVFRFTHRAEEVWRKGWLQSLVTTTNDDGTHWHVKAERSDGALRGTVNGVGFDVSGFVVPASLWHHDTTKSRALFDTIEGRMKVIDVKALGEETVREGGREEPARHFRLSGQIDRDVWYDDACAIAKVVFPAPDGSQITLQRT